MKNRAFGLHLAGMIVYVLGCVYSLGVTFLLLLEAWDDRSKAAAAGYTDMLPSAVFSFLSAVAAFAVIVIPAVLCLCFTKKRWPSILLLVVCGLRAVHLLSALCYVTVPESLIQNELTMLTVWLTVLKGFLQNGSATMLVGLVLLIVGAAVCLKEHPLKHTA